MRTTMAFLLLAVLGGCGSKKDEGIPRPADPSDPSFAAHVKPILEKYCARCHKGYAAKAGYDVSTHAGVLKSGRGVEMLARGEPAKSHLVGVMEGAAGKKKMPPPRESLQPTADEIAVLKSWIAAGAKDN
ncbi:MAG: hypothetical protein K2W96_26660 [Gemmataceae bacterium]|nr:hypothetical protein [Gemmataceae bacterium]